VRSDDGEDDERGARDRPDVERGLGRRRRRSIGRGKRRVAEERVAVVVRATAVVAGGALPAGRGRGVAAAADGVDPLPALLSVVSPPPLLSVVS
jgi:hypothetical protein